MDTTFLLCGEGVNRALSETERIKSPDGFVANGGMNIEWPVLAAAVVAVGLSYLFLLSRFREKNRELKRLEAEHQMMSRELLQVRSQFARELAELTEHNAKRVASLQGNVNDLSALVKGRRA